MGAVQGCLSRGGRDLTRSDPVQTSGVTGSGLFAMDYGQPQVVTTESRNNAASKTIGSVGMFMDSLTQRGQQRISPLETSGGKISIVNPVGASVTGGAEDSNNAGGNSIWTWN